MAAVVHNDSFDAALNKVATSNAVHACTSQPANHASIAAVSVGNYTLTAGTGGGDWSISDGVTSGRRLILAAQSGNNGTATGTANYLAFTDGTTLLLSIHGDGDTVTSGSPYTIAATNVWEIRDPT